tara:strand:+ start:1397 stop:2068 length:672 start_codon:yes stop_codon:yes gene_type:complete
MFRNAELRSLLRTPADEEKGVSKPLDPPTLTNRQRIALFYKTSLSLEEAFAKETIAFQDLVQHGCQAVNVFVAGLTAKDLVAMGCKDAAELTKLGFNAAWLALLDTEQVVAFVDTFGRDSVLEQFGKTCHDALFLVDTPIAAVLGLTPQRLLEMCNSQKDVGCEVLRACPPGSLATFTTAAPLVECGFGPTELAKANVSLHELSTLCTQREWSALGLELTFSK